MIAYNMQMSEMYKNKINLAITKVQCLIKLLSKILEFEGAITSYIRLKRRL